MKRVYIKDGIKDLEKVIIKVEELEDNSITSVQQNSFNNILFLFPFLQKILSNKEDFISMDNRDDGSRIIKTANGTEVFIEKFKDAKVNELLNRNIDEKMFLSFKKRFFEECNETYDSIVFVSSEGKYDIRRLPVSPNMTKKDCIFVNLSLKDGELTDLSKRFLNLIGETELRNWFKVFIANYNPSTTVVYYDAKKMTILSPIIKKYIDPIIANEEGVYLYSLENTYEYRYKGK